MVSTDIKVRIPRLRLSMKKGNGKVCTKTLKAGDYIRFSTSETLPKICLWFVGRLAWVQCKLTWGVFFTDGPIVLAEHYVLLSDVNEIDKVSRRELELDEEKKALNGATLKFHSLLMGESSRQ